MVRALIVCMYPYPFAVDVVSNEHFIKISFTENPFDCHGTSRDCPQCVHSLHTIINMNTEWIVLHSQASQRINLTCQPKAFTRKMSFAAKNRKKEY